jgi:hypothetical protein
MEKIELSVTNALKHFNIEFKRNYTLNDVRIKSGLKYTSLRNLNTDTSFRKLYIICEALYQLYPEMNDGYFDFSFIILRFSDDNCFWV